MDNEQDRTLLDIIRVHLERNEQGKIEWKPDPNGTWNMFNPARRTHSGLITYFEPRTAIGLDEYGNIVDEPISFMLKGRTGRTYYAYRKPTRWQRLTWWFSALITKIRRK